MIENYQQRIEGIITVNRYTFGCFRTCINSLNIWRSVCRNFNIGPYAYWSSCKNNLIKLFIWTAQCIFIWAQSSFWQRNWRCRIWPNAFSELSQPLKSFIFRFNIWQKSHLHNKMKEWRLLLDGRRITLTFLLVLKLLTNHGLILF